MHFKFDGSATDCTTNQVAPLPVGVVNVVWSANRFERTQASASFDGTGGIDFGDIGLADFGLDSFSVTFWLQAGTQDSLIVGKSAALNRGWRIQCENTPQDGLGVRLDLVDGVLSTPDTITTGPGVFGGWHHVGMVVNRSKNLAIAYLDGQPVSSLDISQIGSLANPGHLRVGDRGDGWAQLAGQLDDLRIYGRALSDREVAEIYGELAAYWRFDGNALDQSGNEIHPVAAQQGLLAPDRFGLPNAALQLDGSGHLDFGNMALPDTGRRSFTAVFWVRAGVQDSYLIGNKTGGEAPGPYWTIQCEDTPGLGLGVRLNLSDGTHTTQDAEAPTTGPAVFGDWHHVGVVLDRGSGMAQVFLDGVLRSEFDAGDFGDLSNNQPVRLGWRGDWFKFNGLLDEVRVYNRALPAGELAALAFEGRLSVAVSQVRLCWPTRDERLYQVQYRTALTGTDWVNLGDPVAGTGGQVCATDEVTAPQRFYRVVPVND